MLAVALTSGLAVPAVANDFDALAGYQTVSDATLMDMRGAFIIPPVRGASVAAAITGSQGNPVQGQASILAAPQSNGGVSLGNLPSSGGQVVYFGLQVVSSWQVPTAGGPAGVAAGATIGVDLKTGTPTVTTWTTSTNNGLPATPDTGATIDGAPPANSVVNGVGQSVQVAGNGNSVSNAATVQVGQVVPVLVPGPGSNAPPCGSQCSVTFDNTGLHVSITTPHGAISQAVGQNGITQTVQVASDFNQISNQLGINVQMAPASSFSAGSLLPTIQNVIGIH
jgi:hypothetical protein